MSAVELEQKFAPFQIKTLTTEGSFTGYAAVFNNVDLGGDVIAPGAFAKTIKEKTNHSILWGHSSREVIGVNKSYAEDSKGLLVEGQLVLDVQRAKETYALMKAGAVTGLSIGYDTVSDEYNYETDVRTLKEVKLWEYSFTAFPMNPEAQITGVKNFQRFEQHMNSLIAFLEKRKGKLSPERIAALEKLEQKFSALRAAQLAPAAATQGNSAPDFLHAGLKFESLTSFLKGENR